VIELSDHPDGVILPVKAQPGARATGIRGVHGGALKVAVTQVAEKGKANAALIEALAASLRLARSQIELISGPSQPQKRFLIHGITRAELAARVAAALG
jgi:uncharacterized protein (TIGR00251 family)